VHFDAAETIRSFPSRFTHAVIADDVAGVPNAPLAATAIVAATPAAAAKTQKRIVLLSVGSNR
jgi:hypothetical protein